MNMNMNNILAKIKVFTFYMLMTVWAASCENEDITDFGFDGSFSGTLKDESGNIVPGDITSNGLVVKALGEHDHQVTTDMRVNGDGTYKNTKLYPQTYKIWVSGPVTLVTDTVIIDFAKQKQVNQDLVVSPYVRVGKPVVVGNPSGTSVDVSYEMTPDDGKIVSKRELYCSTNPFPNATTGSGPFYETKKVTLNADAGTATVADLDPHTKYYVRVGVQAKGSSGFNYSEQIALETPRLSDPREKRWWRSSSKLRRSPVVSSESKSDGSSLQFHILHVIDDSVSSDRSHRAARSLS
jgi:hypothetical protein